MRKTISAHQRLMGVGIHCKVLWICCWENELHRRHCLSMATAEEIMTEVYILIWQYINWKEAWIGEKKTVHFTTELYFVDLTACVLRANHHRGTFYQSLRIDKILQRRLMATKMFTIHQLWWIQPFANLWFQLTLHLLPRNSFKVETI